VGAASKLMSVISAADMSLTILKGADHRLRSRDELDVLAGTVMQLWEQVHGAAGRGEQGAEAGEC